MENMEKGSESQTTGRNSRQGGNRAAMFIYIMSLLENVGFIANMCSMVLYFLLVMHFDLSESANTLTNFAGVINLLAILGGFISDVYMTRLNTVLTFALFELLLRIMVSLAALAATLVMFLNKETIDFGGYPLEASYKLSPAFNVQGYIVLVVQAHRSSLHPDALCITCKLKGGNLNIFYLSLALLALGYGGIRGTIPSLGADQFDKNNPKERKQMASFFNFLLMSLTLGGALGVTFIVWISTTKNSWGLGFFISMLLAFVGFIVLTVGKTFYHVRVPGNSPLLSIFQPIAERVVRGRVNPDSYLAPEYFFACGSDMDDWWITQVVVVAIRNRKLALPENLEALHESNDTKMDFVGRIPHTDQFRCLDKAAVPPKSGRDAKGWYVCTVTQVEEVKILTRMLPILGSTIIMNTCLAQLQTFSVQQGVIMDLNLGSFIIPSASIPVIPLLFMSILIPLYEFLLVPFARRLTGNPTGISHLQRVGVGLVLSVVSMSVAGFIEVKRRNAPEKISVFWLSIQYAVFGVADMFTFVGLQEFFYSEAPAGMRSVSTSFTNLSLAMGYFLSSAFVKIVESATARMAENKQGWLFGADLNMNHLERFYWFLAVLSGVNFGVYVLCAKWYKYREDGQVSKLLGGKIEHIDEINGEGISKGNTEE